ncbi:hypothetical protein BZA70DRAFT_71179 [Myxozyma melibiosi]|uniref:DUF5745 domain-containing protein n=1 Tax=Myxozyma melibiosi TaxID=54550 RepID=A0ABR1F1B0_9ASCO
MSSAPASSQLLWLLNALNALFEQHRIAYRVDLPDPTLAQQTPFAAQIHPNALIQLYSALFGSAVSLPTPVQDTFNSRVKSVKMLIGTLAQDVLKMDLSYIDPLAFLAGKEEAVVELVQVVIAVAQIVEKRKKASQAPRRRTNSSSSSNSNLQLSSAAGRLQPHLALSEPSDFDSDDSVEPVSGMPHHPQFLLHHISDLASLTTSFNNPCRVLRL